MTPEDKELCLALRFVPKCAALPMCAAAADRIEALSTEKSEPDDYVAWLTFRKKDGTHSDGRIRICDSDSPGAFKVYRAAPISAVLESIDEDAPRGLGFCPYCNSDGCSGAPGCHNDEASALAWALRDILVTLGNTAIVPPAQLSAARAALQRVGFSDYLNKIYNKHSNKPQGST